MSTITYLVCTSAAFWFGAPAYPVRRPVTGIFLNWARTVSTFHTGCSSHRSASSAERFEQLEFVQTHPDRRHRAQISVRRDCKQCDSLRSTNAARDQSRVGALGRLVAPAQVSRQLHSNGLLMTPSAS